MGRNPENLERAGGERRPAKDPKVVAKALGGAAVKGAKNNQRARDLGRTATRGGR